MKGILRRSVFVKSNILYDSGALLALSLPRLNVCAINLLLPKRLHFKVSVWTAFACNVRFDRFGVGIEIKSAR